MFIFTIICSWFINRKKKYESDSRFYRFLLEACTSLVVFFGGIRVHTSGVDKVPAGKRFLLVGNHLSNFDPILSMHILNKKNKNNLIFISKPENFKAPVFGAIMRRCCFLSIDRESPRDSVKTIMEAADEIKQGKFSVGVYPEGTRNRTGDALLPFHNGMFKIAQMADAPIVVTAIRGSNKVTKNFPWRKTDVYFDVLDVIPAEKVVEKRTNEIGAYIHDIMVPQLAQ